MSEVLTYKRKPPVVQALQWLGQPLDEVYALFYDHSRDGDRFDLSCGDSFLFISSRSGGMALTVYPRNYIVFKGKGKIKVYTEEDFRTRYEVC